jgi:GDP/UDP-N,N'-diacetylbacillosamine 2-epimerase (hydrolysing)
MGAARVSKRKIAVFTATRATYGYNRLIMKRIHEAEDLELQLIVSGMHLLKQFGLTIREVEADGLPIAARVDMQIGGDTPGAFAKSLGVLVQSLAQVFTMLEPDLLLVSGDRGEMLASTVTAAYMNIPVAHLQSGDVTGHIDNSARHAITKFAHIHFPACEDSAERVLKLGEEPWRVFNVGAPQLDAVVHEPKLPKEELAARFGLDLDQPLLLVLQHPILAEVEDTRAQMIETMEAIQELGLQSMVIYPNVDAAGEEIIRVIREYQHLPFVKTFQNVDRQSFLSLLTAADALVGNSSCGILEAPSFKLPAINIGNRQRGRMQATNVLNCPHDRAEIAQAIRTALHDAEYRARLRDCVNPYGDGNSSARVVQILREIPIDQRLIDKLITY